MEYTFLVKRTRQSVTQGNATVYLNGIEIVCFGDTIELIKDGQEYYGEKIGDWASVKPDSVFILGVLWHPYDKQYQYSDRVVKVLKHCDPKSRNSEKPESILADIAQLEGESVRLFSELQELGGLPVPSENNGNISGKEKS